MSDLTLTEPETILAAAAIALVAGFVRGFAGFGGPAIMLLVLTTFYSPLSVLPKVIVMDYVANLGLLPGTVRTVRWRRFLPVLIGTLLGMPLGSYLLVTVDPLWIKRAIALVTAACTLVLLAGWRYRREQGPVVQLGAGLAAGVTLGATFLALVAMIFFFAGPARAAVSRAHAVMWGFVTSSVLIAYHVAAGTLRIDDIWRSLGVALVYLLASLAGARAFRRSGETGFRRAVLWLLIGLSVIALAT